MSASPASRSVDAYPDERAGRESRSEPPTSSNVLLITGSGRSGSTLLSMLLGATPGSFNGGELSHFWLRGWAGNHLCGCGERVRTCPFWTGVTASAALDVDERDARKTHEIQLQAVRRHSLWRRAGRLQGNGAADTTRRLYSAIARRSQADWLIDSSKNPVYTRYLMDALGGDRVHVLHLVRDPRGVAFSAAKRRLKDDAGDSEIYMNQKGYVESALNWAKVQVSAELLALSAASYHRLRYEDLCEHGEEPVQHILQDIDAGLAARYRSASARRANGAGWGRDQHTVSGNPMRISSGTRTIKPDLEWRESLPSGAYRAISAVTLPLLLRYGYSLGRA